MPWTLIMELPAARAGEGDMPAGRLLTWCLSSSDCKSLVWGDPGFP